MKAITEVLIDEATAEVVRNLSEKGSQEVAEFVSYGCFNGFSLSVGKNRDETIKFNYTQAPLHAWVEVRLAEEGEEAEYADPLHQRIANGKYWAADDKRRSAGLMSSGFDDGPASGAVTVIEGKITVWMCDEEESPSVIYRRADGELGTFI